MNCTLQMFVGEKTCDIVRKCIENGSNDNIIFFFIGLVVGFFIMFVIYYFLSVS